MSRATRIEDGSFSLSDAAQRWIAGLELPEPALVRVRRCAATLERNILVAGATAKPLPWSPRRGICPSPRTYRGVWNWDSAFHALTVARWDPELAWEQISIFFDVQRESGLLPDVWFEDGRLVDAFGKPPVFPWAVVLVDRRAPNGAWLEARYDQLLAYARFWETARFDARFGLFHYSTSTEVAEQRETEVRFESGWDTSPRWDRGAADLLPVDLNCYMVLTYRALAYIADRLGRADGAHHRAKARELEGRIEDMLFSAPHGAYCDLSRSGDGHSGVLSPASFMPLFAGFATKARARSLAQIARDEAKFYPAIPSVSYDHPAYNSGDYWRGPTWLNVGYFAARGLARYGFEIGAAMQRWMLDAVDSNGDAVYEYYDSRSSAGLGAPHFGWSAAFAIEMTLGPAADDALLELR